MSNKDKTLERHARDDWNQESLSWEALQFGALQRIATALEKIANTSQGRTTWQDRHDKKVRSLETRVRKVTKQLKDRL